MKTRSLYRSQSMHAHPEMPVPLAQNWPEMSGSMVEMMGATPRIGRRSMALADIDPKYVSQSGIWEASEVETSRGSIRIQHLTPGIASAGGRSLNGSTASGIGGAGGSGRPRFEKLEECAHFHYEIVELKALKITIKDEEKGITSIAEEESSSPSHSSTDNCTFTVQVASGVHSWTIRRTHANLVLLDKQIERCVWARSYSKLEKVQEERTCYNSEDHVECREFVERYFNQLNRLPTDRITCGTVLGWLELDQAGRHTRTIDDSDINTPAVAAACSLRKYVAQAPDELSFDVGEMISVIDMPPPKESILWRGKQGFKVGFFPGDCVQVIGDKVPSGLPIPPTRRRSGSTANNSPPMPPPVLRKHPKLIAFFRSFILNRPSRRRLKQIGLLKERVFSCDLAEHLLSTGNDIPTVLKCCAEFIEMHGIVDGIYRLSGITSNIQKLRNDFDEDKVPNLEEDEAIKQDIHAVSSLLKMYFRELPNPLCTYQLYEKFVVVAQMSDAERLFKMREVVHELPPPHYRTLEYLMKHLARVASRSKDTGMTPKNMAIVWAPNLIRCKELESGGVEALKGIGVQAVVTEYLVRHADLIFNEKLPANLPPTTTLVTQRSASSCSYTGRPKSLAISSPIRLMSLEEAQDKAKDERRYIEVGGGPASLPPKYHTVIEHPSRRGMRNKRSPIKWKHFFRKGSVKGGKADMEMKPVIGQPTLIPTSKMRRHSKSVESLVSPPTSFIPSYNSPGGGKMCDPSNSMERMLDVMETVHVTNHSKSQSKSSPNASVAQVVIHPPPPEDDTDYEDAYPGSSRESRSMEQHNKGHSRSLSHDSYFEFGEFHIQNKVSCDDILEEESMSQESSKLSLENPSSSGLESNDTSPRKRCSSGGFSADAESNASKSYGTDGSFRSPVTPPPSVASIQDNMMCSFTSEMSTSSEDVLNNSDLHEPILSSKSPILRPRTKSKKWRGTGIVESESTFSPTHGACSNSTSSKDELLKNQHFRSLQNTVFTLEEEEPEPCEFSFKPLIPTSSTCSSIKHELDKNSSIDESSNDSTPGDVHPGMTNIIYSPLINEIISPSSTTNSSSCEHLVVSCNPLAMQTGNLFVCPLYEAGVQSSDFSSDNEQIYTRSTATTEVSQDSDTVSDKSITPVPAVRSERSSNRPRAHYENVVIQPKECTTIREEREQEPVVNRTESHFYVNERTYENDGVGSEEMHESSLPPVSASERDHMCSVNSGGSDISGDGFHYENMGDSETYNKSNTYGSVNIYEDIDDDHSGPAGLDPRNSYEQVGSSQHEPSPPLPAVNVPGNAKSQTQEEEGESPYESVQYSRDEQHRLVAHHHYAEIAESNNTNATLGAPQPNVSVSEESSESHSHTEDIVTYLEVKPSGIRSDSLDEQDHLQEEIYMQTANSSDSSTAATPNNNFKLSIKEDEEIRHIDSPILVDNPLYSLEGISDSSANENKASGEGVCVRSHSAATKVLGRCNSAPLPLKLSDASFAITDFDENSFNNPDEDNDDDTKDLSTRSDSILEGNAHRTRSASHDEDADAARSKQLLCKRLSEPSLHDANNPTQPPKNKLDPGFTAWKIADAKRLANRKQSVKELLTKFESTVHESQSSGSSASINSNGSQTKSGNNRNSTCSRTSSQSGGSKPGLPRPDSKPNVSAGGVSNNAFVKLNNNNNNARSRPGGGSARFQHHRFSMGDILMTHSVSSADEIAEMQHGVASMIRSDTFPELRTEASKENDDDGMTGSCHSLGGGGPPVEKVQNALRVAMSSVDMNDPSTRERIEKYKEERRSFLRQKISSEMSGPSSESKDSVASVKSPDRDSVSSTDSVFTTATVKIFSNAELNPPPTYSNVKTSDSPRKRAFSEDLLPVHGNQFKSIKTDIVFCGDASTSIDTDKSNGNTESNEALAQGIYGTEEEVNVREKVALWADRKERAVSDNTTGLLSDVSMNITKDVQLPPIPIKSTMKQAVSLPPEGFTKLPVLKRDGNLESAKLITTKVRSLSTRSDGGKKIKDMAAFFENKQF